MDYLDELDDSVIEALNELSGSIDAPSTIPTAATNNIPPFSARQAQCRRRVQATYLVRLEHPFSSPQDLASIIGLSRVPQLETGSAEDGEAHFCRLHQPDMERLESWTAEHYPKKKLTKIRLCIAHKDPLKLPILGRDPTLPHHRPSEHPLSANMSIRPKYEYPIYYFFYGTLASASRLSQLFGIPSCQLPRLEPATLLDGKSRVWAGKYRALVDSPGGEVEEYVYPVTSIDQEDALRVYEGDAYEVVSARVILKDREIDARAFRFSGVEEELAE
jgi:hypothetical protein